MSFAVGSPPPVPDTRSAWSSPFVQLPLILGAAIVLRAVHFVGFGLGDDPGYVGHVDVILQGGYPPLDSLNQYAYRPLLLLLFAAGVAGFGHTDFGVVAPVLAASLVTTALVYTFVRTLIDRDAAWCCALLHAFQPFDIVNSTTMTNDVILACLTFASVGMFLLADATSAASLSRRRFAGAAAIMLAAFLVKITILPALALAGLVALAAFRRRPRETIARHGVFFAAFFVGLTGVAAVYFLRTGDLFWQFKSELFYYQAHKPDWYLAGRIDYASMMWQYPRSLFWLSGDQAFRYLEHGVLFWLFIPAAGVALVRGRPALRWMAVFALLVFAFFEFYPQYVRPWYLPLVRQERYLEMLVPPAVIVVGVAFARVLRSHPRLATAVLCLVLADFVVQANRRWHHYSDSMRDVRELARFARVHLADSEATLAIDTPAWHALSFYLKGSGVETRVVDRQALAGVRQGYVVVGGARAFWWAHDTVLDVDPAHVPPGWRLVHEIPGKPRPWRRSSLRVYHTGRSDEAGRGSTQ